MENKAFPPFRIWLKPNDTKNIVFLDNGTVGIYEHEFMNTTYKKPVYYTCSKKSQGKCFFCEQGVPSYFGKFYTVIDLTEFTGSKGQKRKNEKRLLCAKNQTQYLLAFKLKIRGTFYLAQYAINRSGDKTPATGDVWEYVDTVSATDMNFSDVTPYNYLEILKPISYQEQQQVIHNLSWRKDSKIVFGNTIAIATPVQTEIKPEVKDDEEIPF